MSAASVGLGAAATALGGCAAPAKGNLARKSGRRVIVVGGGWGGATAAKYIRLQDPSIEVVLLEPNRTFVSCPFSNLVLSGVETIDALTLGYDGLRAHGVKIRHEAATAIEPDTKRVRIGEGYLEYDRLIVSPGVDFVWDQVDGRRRPGGDRAPRVEGRPADRRARPAPPGPAGRRCGPHDRARPSPTAARPGPYERACQIAWYLKTKKPQAKLIVLDANNDVISKAALFKAAFRAYPNLDYRPTTGSSASTSARARSSRPSATACATTS